MQFSSFQNMLSRINQKHLYWLSLILLLGFVFAAFCGVSEQELGGIWFNSDSLYLPSIYKDVFVDGNTLQGWHLNSAPNFFPDWFLYVGLNGLTGNFIVASFLFGIIQVFLISILSLLVLKRVSEKAHYYVTLGNVLLLLFPFTELIENDFHFFSHLVMNSFHIGAFINTLLALWLAFSFWKTQKKYWLVLLLVVGVLALVSDRLFIVSFIVPMASVAMLLVYRKTHYALYTLGTLVLIYTIGMLLFGALQRSDYFVILKQHKLFDWAFIGDSFAMFWDQFTLYWNNMSVRILIFILTFLVMIACIIWCIRKLPLVWKKSIPITNGGILLKIFATLFLSGVWLAPMMMGQYTGHDTIRYNYSAYLLAILFLPFLFPFKTKQLSIKVNSILLLTVAALLGFFLFQNGPDSFNKQYLNYYPKMVQDIDKIGETKGIKIGLAPYWKAKVITQFSRKGIRAYTAFEPLTPWGHVTNSNWHHKDPKDWSSTIVYDFVLADSPSMIDSTRLRLAPLLDSHAINGGTVIQTRGFNYETTWPYPSIIEDRPAN